MSDIGPREWVDMLSQPVHAPSEEDRCLARVALAGAAWRFDASGDLPHVLEAVGLT